MKELAAGLAAIDDKLLAAHARDDAFALTVLYGDAGDAVESSGDADAACFYFTQAYVYALEAGHELAARYKASLVRYGREPSDDQWQQADM